MPTYNYQGLEITCLYHSGFKIKSDNIVIYTDPYKVLDDESADLILISHDHFDHLDPDSINKIKKAETIVVAPSGTNAAVDNLKSMKVDDVTNIAGIRITAFPAYNLTLPNHPKDRGYLGYIIEIEGKRIYFAGDTDKVPEMENLKNIDVAMLPIGGGPTMDETQAAEAVKIIKPKIVIPMHYKDDVIPAGDANKFIQLVGSSSQVVVLE